MKKCLFLDRDGIINRIYDSYFYDVEKLEIIPGIEKVVKAFKDRGYIVIIISNQGGVGAGYYPQKAVYDIEDAFKKYLAKFSLTIEGSYYCFHHEIKGIGKYKIACNCRKPAPGMILSAQKDFDVDLKNSFFLGDNITDAECAKNAGVKYHQFDFTDSIPTERGKRIVITSYEDDFVETLLQEAGEI